MIQQFSRVVFFLDFSTCFQTMKFIFHKPTCSRDLLRRSYFQVFTVTECFEYTRPTILSQIEHYIMLRKKKWLNKSCLRQVH